MVDDIDVGFDPGQKKNSGPDDKGNGWWSRSAGVLKYAYVRLPAVIPASLATYGLTMALDWQAARSAFWYLLAVLACFAIFTVLFWLLIVFLNNHVQGVEDEKARFRYTLLFAAYLFVAYAAPVGVLAWEISNANHLATGVVAVISGLVGYFLFKNLLKEK